MNSAADYYPVHLDLSEKPVLVVGSDKVAGQKADGLKAAGAKVLQVEPEEYSPSDLKGVWLVIAATPSSELNAQILADASKKQIWVNSADDPANSTAILPARLTRGKLVVTVSTSGVSPAFAVWLRNRLEDQVGAQYQVLLEVVSRVREEIRSAGESSELYNWQSALDLAITKGVLKLVEEGNEKEAEELIRQCLYSS